MSHVIQCDHCKTQQKMPRRMSHDHFPVPSSPSWALIRVETCQGDRGGDGWNLCPDCVKALGRFMRHA